MSGERMSERVRGYLSKSRAGRPRSIDMSADDLPGPSSAEWSTMVIQEDHSFGAAPVLAGTSFPKVPEQSPNGTPTERDESLPISLPPYNCQALFQTEIAYSKPR